MKSSTIVPTVVGMALFGCAGCASTLNVSTVVTDGLPLPEAVPYVEFLAKDTHSKGGKCAPVLEARHIALPGKPVYVNVGGGTFAKAGLVVKYSDRGMVTEVSFNSELSADAIAAATGAATALLPFVGILPGTRASAAAAAPMAPMGEAGTTQRIACDSGAVPLRLVPLSDYLEPSKLEALVSQLRLQIAAW